MKSSESLSQRAANFLERRSGWLILGVVAITALLAVPMVTMIPDENASDNPGGEVFDLEDLVDEKLEPPFYNNGFVVEARGGDVVTQAPLWELYQNTQALREADQAGKLNPPGLPEQQYLASGFDVDRQQPIVGIYTLADAVQEVLTNDPRLNTTLEQATDDQVKLAVHQVLSDPRTEGLEASLSFVNKKKERRTVLGQEIDYWTSPALTIFVVADNEKLGGGTERIGGTTDPVTEGKERFSRQVQKILRGDESSYSLWGIAIDIGLEIADEIATAVPFIAATFVVVLIVVGISLRSFRAVLLTAVGLLMMIIWLKGTSNLVGLKSSTVLDFIVPIAMISLGADFVIHAVNRYREEKRTGLDPRRSFRIGMAGVLGALVLALVTDAIAFLSNATAEIETVIGFGIGAAVAILAAFVILGLTVPLALMRLDAWRARPPASDTGVQGSESRGADGMLSRLVVALAQRRAVVLPVAAAVTAVAAYYAVQLEPRFAVSDLLKADSDFVVGLDKLEEHLGDSAGEPAIIYIEGDLSDPAALASVQDFIGRLSDNQYVGKNDLGEATLQARPIFFILDQVLKSEYARSRIEEASGVMISAEGDLGEFRNDDRSYRWPKSPEQLRAIYDYIAVNGVPAGPEQNIYEVQDVRATLFHDPAGGRPDATSIVLGIPDTVEQANVIGSRDTLTEEVESLERAPSISRVGLTGSPYTRQAGLDATFDGLQRALPLAVVLCLAVAVVAMRSVRLGVVTTIPIVLVVAWLYAFMKLFGFGLNFMTATIAAISIGVGIDYAIHMTQRFREELARAADSVQALERAARGTGVALVASAVTSIAGFSIMGLAPMPFFASYGLLTAVMIFFAVAASLLVLPSLLLLVTPRGAGQTEGTHGAAAAD